MPVPIGRMITEGVLPSFLKVWLYRLRGASIGKDVNIGLFSIIDSKEIEINDGVSISPFCFISCKKLKLGKRVKIGLQTAIETGEVNIDNDTVLMEQIIIGGMLTSKSKISIGKRVKIFPFCFINPTDTIIIEDDVGIGGSNYIFTHGSWQSVLDGFPVSFGPVTIKRGVWFPWRVFVMPNVTVGEFATIGAGSVITKDIPPMSLAVGSPARVVKSGSQYIKQYSPEEKNKIIIDILKEFVDFIQYKLNKTASTHEILNGFKIVFEKNFSVLYTKQYDGKENADAIISLNEMEELVIQDLISQKKIWFDISGKKTHYLNNEWWLLLKDYFSRYGIRFEIEG